MSNEIENMYRWRELVEANGSIKTTDIKGKEYAEVHQRIKAFRMLCPHGTISTELVSNENGVCVFRATVLDENGIILGTGTAYEKESSSFINKTSYIENCETSAVGRALGMAGFGIDTSVASYEEVANAIENQNKDNAKKDNAKKDNAKKDTNNIDQDDVTYNGTVKVFIKLHGLSFAKCADKWGLTLKTTEERFKEVYEELQTMTAEQLEELK